jgi:histidinol-phosphate aminotransferase
MRGHEFVRKDIRSMKAYEEEPQGGLDLMANTNLFGPNPALGRAFATLRPERFSEYPTLTSATLQDAVARKLGVTPGMVVTGNGSNELIDELCRALLEPGERAAFHVPTFSMIPAFIAINHGAGVGVPLGAEWSLDADALAAVARAKLTFVVRPNNPTGNAFPRKDVERVLERAEGIVVVDEAYIEFLGGESFVKEVRAGNDRLVVLRTFSKAHGLAGLRIGYAVCAEPLATELTKVRGPFRLDLLAETVGALALADDRYVDGVVKGVRDERPNLKRMLEERGFTVFRSDANFFLTKPPADAHALAKALGAVGVWVREFSGDLAPYLRITVGPPAVTARLRVALDDVLPKLRSGAS